MKNYIIGLKMVDVPVLWKPSFAEFLFCYIFGEFLVVQSQMLKYSYG